MVTFTDRTGDAWTVTLTYAEFEDARTIGIELGDILSDGKGVTSLLSAGQADFFRLMWLLCEGQVKAKGLDDRGFKGRLDGATVQRFTAALLEEAVSFFPLAPLAKSVGGSVPKLIEAMSAPAVREYESRLTSSLSGTPPPGSSASRTSGP